MRLSQITIGGFPLRYIPKYNFLQSETESARTYDEQAADFGPVIALAAKANTKTSKNHHEYVILFAFERGVD